MRSPPPLIGHSWGSLLEGCGRRAREQCPGRDIKHSLPGGARQGWAGISGAEESPVLAVPVAGGDKGAAGLGQCSCL